MSLRSLCRAVAAFATFGVVSTVTLSAAASDPEEPTRPSREPSPSGPRIALRTGVAVPFGSAYTASGALSDTITGYVPIRLDVGYRIARHLYIGADVQLATILPNACPSGGSCTGSDVRFGAMVAYHLLPGAILDPWIGLGMGYERLNVSRTVDGSTGEVSARGLELADIDIGLDVRPTRSFRLGPVLSSSFTRFTRVAINGVATTDFDPAVHAWVLLGFRGAFDL